MIAQATTAREPTRGGMVLGLRLDLEPGEKPLDGFIGLPEGAAGTTTVESKTNFVGAARVGATLVGACAVVHRGRRTQVLQTRVETEEGKLVALVVQTQTTL